MVGNMTDLAVVAVVQTAAQQWWPLHDAWIIHPFTTAQLQQRHKQQAQYPVCYATILSVRSTSFFYWRYGITQVIKTLLFRPGKVIKVVSVGGRRPLLFFVPFYVSRKLVASNELPITFTIARTIQ